jgi:hypothetical protein
MTIQHDSIKPDNLTFRSGSRLYGITYLLIFGGLALSSIKYFELSVLWLVWLFISKLPLNFVYATALLRITDTGLLIRRGWQRALIPWSSIEALGIAKGKVLTSIPYIVLREPIARFPKVTLAEVAPEQQNRAITLEGWSKHHQLFETLFHRISKNNTSFYVMPEIKRYSTNFLYYEKIDLYLTFINLGLFAIAYSIYKFI